MSNDDFSYLSEHSKVFATFLVEQWDQDQTAQQFSQITSTGSGRIHVILDHPRLHHRNLPEVLRQGKMLYTALEELIDAGLISKTQIGLVLKPQLRSAVKSKFRPKIQPVLSRRLRTNSKQAAQLLSEYIRSGELNECFNYTVVDADGVTIFIEDEEDHQEFGALDSEESPLLIPDVVRDLEQSGLIDVQQTSGDAKRICVRPELHDAVDSDFAVAPPANAMHVSNMYVTVDRAYISELVSDPHKLADALAERLIPALSKEAALNTFYLQELRNSIDELRSAMTETDKRTIVQRIFSTIAVSADLFTLYQILALLTGLPR